MAHARAYWAKRSIPEFRVLVPFIVKGIDINVVGSVNRYEYTIELSMRMIDGSCAYHKQELLTYDLESVYDSFKKVVDEWVPLVENRPAVTSKINKAVRKITDILITFIDERNSDGMLSDEGDTLVMDVLETRLPEVNLRLIMGDDYE